MAFDLLDFTKKLESQLENEDLYVTHVFIAYKVMMYYENNIGQITEAVKPTLLEIIQEIYEIYTQNDDVELLDSLVSQKIQSL
ncbi:hypothetical protein [Acholeplasma laidlawii]|jgi:hypothetical protein|uniref:Uncharacterized protein n=2 Tax=Acholeplasma laidlawii TaxID=2148 RepID=A9NH61_ACHLI|nr:hypothetical protein [Acholeplasma laidlawii]ABX81691.1 hypothetical protein ACL_1081 [Acholeplasma laidlawii PG-8A]NWH09732.1 hypothetical protein [Acholeplasma laidlawii]NWH11123.1 hypothetical protein [Acholeplasma laidlawii]NWH13466.1 hypothetical protein [Acholeplasma laidlawii]NWH14555.1 hypothetical protein [Acholeplasma laidlawii]